MIEDDADLRTLVCAVLRRAGYVVASAATGEEGLFLAARRRPDAAVVDVRLPDRSGREVCRRLRADPRTENVHLILVSGLGAERDRVAGFESGADDYLSKPFSLRELVLRLRAVARRTTGVSPPLPAVPPPAPVPIRVDEAAHRVWVGDREVELTLTEYRLLAYLVAHTGRLCSRADLLQRVWDMPPHLNTRTVDTHVKRVRTKLGEAAPTIETVRGAGYRYQPAGVARSEAV